MKDLLYFIAAFVSFAMIFAMLILAYEKIKRYFVPRGQPSHFVLGVIKSMEQLADWKRGAEGFVHQPTGLAVISYWTDAFNEDGSWSTYMSPSQTLTDYETSLLTTAYLRYFEAPTAAREQDEVARNRQRIRDHFAA